MFAFVERQNPISGWVLNRDVDMTGIFRQDNVHYIEDIPDENVLPLNRDDEDE